MGEYFASLLTFLQPSCAEEDEKRKKPTQSASDVLYNSSIVFASECIWKIYLFLSSHWGATVLILPWFTHVDRPAIIHGSNEGVQGGRALCAPPT